VKHRILRIGLIAGIALTIPSATILAHGPSDTARSHANEHANLPADDEHGQPEAVGKPENAGERPENHGWFVSQVAHDHSLIGRAHGEAVSEVARSDAGKPDSAP